MSETKSQVDDRTETKRTDNLFRCPNCPGQLKTDDTVVFREKVWTHQTCKDCGAELSSWFHVDDCTRVKCHEEEEDQ